MAEVALRLGDDISTDAIYPGRFMATGLPSETPQYCFADLKEFNARLREGKVAAGSVVVGDSNFGTGSSREQAASCMKGYDLVVVAKNYARIFFQNSLNVGLRLVICPEVEASEGDDLEITTDKVINRTTGKSFDITPLPPARQAILDAGGLVPYVRKKLLEERAG
ncbi:MAG TPA: 3-isopropylmalate dehydratase small subunit [Thermoleophilia bacterium]